MILLSLLCNLEDNHHLCYHFCPFGRFFKAYIHSTATVSLTNSYFLTAINLSLGLQVLLGLGAHSLGTHTGPGFNSISLADAIPTDWTTTD